MKAPGAIGLAREARWRRVFEEEDEQVALDKLTVSELIELGQPDPLMARIDSFSTDERWADMIDLRDRCREAVERGKQLWGVAHHVDYRLALEAPPELAAVAADSPASRFTLGPLTEVAASTHTWTELEPYLASGPIRSMVANERAVRGEDLSGAVFDRHVLEMPDSLLTWEPQYSAPEYKRNRVESDPPIPDDTTEVELPSAGETINDPLTVEALLALTATWTEQSNGIAEARAVEGTALSAIASLGLRRARISELRQAEAFNIMAWTASDSGAHGRRAGLAAGRMAAWWVAAAAADLLDEWPLDPKEFSDDIAHLNWYWWSDPYPSTGWACRIAIEDPEANYAWVLNAADAE